MAILSVRPERVVIKLGTSSLIVGGQPDPVRLADLSSSLARLRADGNQVVIVASGAIALGDASLSAGQRSHPAARQVAAAVGQSRLFNAFRGALQEQGLVAAQILLTPPDLTEPYHRGSVQAILNALLAMGIVPVVNENDAIMVRNNDTLAAMIAVVIGAGRLVLLTDVCGLYDRDPHRNSAALRIPSLPMMTTQVERLASLGAGTGGMPAKLCAIWIATMAGIPAVIAGVDTPDVVVRVMRGDDVGTVVHPWPETRQRDVGRLWRALSQPPSGRLVCDDETASVVAGNAPLTARHVLHTIGEFDVGDVIDIVTGNTPTVIARGRSQIGAMPWARLTADPIVVPSNDYISFMEA